MEPGTHSLERQSLFIARGEDQQRQVVLLDIGFADYFLGLSLCLFQGGRDNRKEQSDDGDDDEQFDQRKGGRGLTFATPCDNGPF